MSAVTTPLNALAVSPDGRLLVAANKEGGFQIGRTQVDPCLAYDACHRRAWSQE